VGRILKVVAGVFGFLLYVWFAAVRSVPVVKRRKAARRPRGKAARPS
jgi:hypothetical protein